MIIDCHYHIDTRMLPVDDLLRKMDAAGIDKVALMAPLNDPIPEPPAIMVSALQFFLMHRSLRWIGRLGATRFTKDGDFKLPNGVAHIYRDVDNGLVFQAVAAHPDRFLGWIFVNPRSDNDMVSEFEKWRGQPGVVGVKAHPSWHRYPPKELAPVAERCAEVGLPLLIHAGFGEHGDFESLLAQVPNLKLILAHAGFPLFGDCWDAIKKYDTVFVDLSATSFVSEKALKAAVEYLGVERCFFGTDGPYGSHGADGTFDPGCIKQRIERNFPDTSTRAMLLGDNFAACAQIS